MSDREIKISIKTDADVSGAEKAQAAVEKVSQAAAASNAVGFGGQLESLGDGADLQWDTRTQEKLAQLHAELAENLSSVKEELKGVADEADNAGTKLEEAGEHGGKLEQNVSEIGRAQKAQALAQLAEKAGLIGDKFREAANEVEDFDREAATKLRNTADRIDQVSSAISAVAMGFAMGGPVGAAVAGLAVGLNVLIEQFMASEVVALKAAATQRAALAKVDEKMRESHAMLEDRNAQIDSASVLAALDAQRKALADQTAELERQLGAIREKRRLDNEILDATDQLKLAEIDGQEAKGESTPVIAAKQRAEVELAARKRMREDRKIEALEDAKKANEEGVIAAEFANTAAKQAEELEKKRAQSEADAAGKLRSAESGTKGDASFFTSNPEYQVAYKGYEQTRGSGIESEIEASGKDLEALKIKLVMDAVSDASIALEKLKEYSGASKEANDIAAKAAQDAGTARRKATDANKRSSDVSMTMSELDKTDGKTVERVQMNRVSRALDAEQKRQNQQEREEQMRRIREEKDQREADLNTRAETAGERIVKSGQGGRIAQDIGKSLADGTNDKEIANLITKIQQNKSTMDKTVVSYLEQLLGTLEDHGRQIYNLGGQIKTVANNASRIAR